MTSYDLAVLAFNSILGIQGKALDRLLVLQKGLVMAIKVSNGILE
jgi:hypothetical protein